MSILAGIGALAGIGTSIANTVNQYGQLNYQKEVQKKTWEREDNAVQRRVADLNAAGLSPTLAAGSAAQASTPIQVGAPQFGNVQDKILKAQESLAMRKQLAQTQAQIDLVEAQKDNVDMQSAEVAYNLAKAQELGITTRMTGALPATVATIDKAVSTVTGSGLFDTASDAISLGKGLIDSAGRLGVDVGTGFLDFVKDPKGQVSASQIASAQDIPADKVDAFVKEKAQEIVKERNVSLVDAIGMVYNDLGNKVRKFLGFKEKSYEESKINPRNRNSKWNSD